MYSDFYPESNTDVTVVGKVPSVLGKASPSLTDFNFDDIYPLQTYPSVIGPQSLKKQNLRSKDLTTLKTLCWLNATGSENPITLSLGLSYQNSYTQNLTTINERLIMQKGQVASITIDGKLEHIIFIVGFLNGRDWFGYRGVDDPSVFEADKQNLTFILRSGRVDGYLLDRPYCRVQPKAKFSINS